MRLRCVAVQVRAKTICEKDLHIIQSTGAYWRAKGETEVWGLPQAVIKKVSRTGALKRVNVLVMENSSVVCVSSVLRALTLNNPCDRLMRMT